MAAAELYRYNRETNGFTAVSQLDNCRAAAGPGETVAIGASVTRSVTPFPTGTTAVRLRATVDCWVEIGPGTPSAVASTSFFLGANEPEYFAANPGDVVAVLQASAAGFLYERPVL